jgi:hypothetical protein
LSDADLIDLLTAEADARLRALVAVLERTREAATGTGTVIEAQVTAALARQLAHSVARDRRRARPLANRAVELARDLEDPITLAGCMPHSDSRTAHRTASDELSRFT